MEKLPVRLVLLSLIFCPLFAQVAQVRHAPTLNGKVLGSIQQMTAESTTLNGNAAISGDLLLPGTPTVQLNGNPAYGGTLDGTGAVSPTNHKVTLNGSAALDHVVRRTDAITLPVVNAPPAPTGTTTLSLSAPGQTVDWPTVRNLTLNSGAGQYAVPAGSYGDFTANGGSSFSLGVVGSTTPTVYNFQNLTLNGSSRLEVVGPVIVTLANAISVNGSLGSSANPSWLVFKLASGGLTLNGGVSFYGYVTAPSGTVALNGNSQLVGGLIADRLTLNGNSLLHLLAAPTANVPPTVTLTAPANGATYTGSASFTLAATAADTDGTVSKVEFYQGTVKLGEDTTTPFTLAHSVNSPGVYTYVARATDNQGTTGDSAAVSITVTSPNQPPTVALTAPADGTLLTAPADVLLTATASDPDGSIGKVEFYKGTTKLWEDTTAPYEYSVTNLAIGTYSFSARAFDLQSLATTSASVAVTVVAPNVAPTVALTAPPDGASFTAPATFTLTATAADSDGLVTKVEFFQGASKVGEDSFVPYELTISSLTAGSYSYVARATDSTGSATDSAPVTVSVTTVNTLPTVALTAPTTGASYMAPATILLSATAADSDGTVTKVEFYQGAIKLGESLVTPYEFNWLSVAAGTYSLSAKAIDNQGAVTASAAVSVTVNTNTTALPIIAEFEPSEGYVTGPLAGQKGWTASAAVTVVALNNSTSLQEVSLGAGQPPVQLGHVISAPGATPVFVDFFARPVAGLTVSTAVTFSTSAARLALVGTTSPASLQVFDGNVWHATGKTVVIDATGRTVDWLRLTTREDYTAKKWDLYADGHMIVADVPFMDNTANSLATFGATGHATVVSSFDDFYAGVENPIAADTDHDGMDDAWETAHGLNITLNDRGSDFDADGLTNIAEYVFGSKPNNTDTDSDGLTDIQERTLGTNPIVADTDGDGLPDGWEVTNGLAPRTASDAGADPDNDGLTNLQEYQRSTNPTNPDTDGDGMKDGVEVSLGTNPLVADLAQAPAQVSGRRIHLKADAGVTLDGTGNVSTWTDQSGLGNNANQTTSVSRPLLVSNALNAQPVLRFDGSNDSLQLPDTAKNGLTATELFIVLKGTEEQGTYRKPFSFGGADGLLYPAVGGVLWDDTGSSAIKVMGDPPLPLDQWRVYNSNSTAGEFTARMDGAVIYQTLTNTVGFRASSFHVGKGADGYNFMGDIAEIIVYDHVLTAQEREVITRYLTAKYALDVTTAAAPTALAAQAVSASQVSLTWTPGDLGAGVAYEIERRSGSGAYASLGEVTDSTTHLDTGLTTATAYTYRVRARTLSGLSIYSAEASVTTFTADVVAMPTSGMRLWLKADTGLARGNLERVALWPDQSGLHNDALQYAAATSQPLWVANGVNSKPVLRFDGSNDSLQLPDTAKNGLAATELFIVLKGTEEQGAYRKPFSFGGADGLLYPAVGGVLWDDTGSSTIKVMGDPPLPLDQWRVYNSQSAPGDFTARLDGGVIYQTFTNTVGFRPSSFHVGKGADGYNFMGDIAEIIVYDHVLSALERETVTRYLVGKYALGATTAAAPTALTVQAVSASQLNVAWTPGAAGAGVTYVVERRTGSGSYSQVAEVMDSASYFDANLLASTAYTYRVRTRTTAGVSAYSTEATATTLASAAALPTTGMRFWLKADAGLVRGNLERVARWPDQSGLHNDALQYASATSQPLWVVSGVNGKPVLRFDGSNDSLQLPDTAKNGLTATELFIVLKGTEEQGTYRKPFSFGGADGLLYPAVGGVLWDDTGSSAIKVMSDPPLPLDQWRVYNSQSAPGDFIARLDGGMIYQSFTNTVGFRPSSFHVGKGADGYNFLGDIAEIIVYDHVLSVQEREVVTRYLALKYGLMPGYVNNTSIDSNGDGLSDSVNVQLGIDPLDMDVDDDGVSNAGERAQGTDPFNADSDGDGVPDGTDAYPLDPTRWQAGGGTSGDTTPPVITLIKPANAVPQP